jgi:hypothetical protein
MTKHLLKNLELDEISLVDSPANQLATVALFKRHEENMEDKAKMTDEAIAEVVTKSEKLTADNQRLTKALIENGFVIRAETIEKRMEDEMVEIGGEKIAKSSLPAVVLKALEDATESQKVAKAAQEAVALTKRCEEILPNIPVDNATALLKGLDTETHLEFLKSIDAAFAALTEEVGKSAPKEDLTDPQERLDALVKSQREANPSLTKEQAFAAVAKTSEGNKLISKSYNKEV